VVDRRYRRQVTAQDPEKRASRPAVRESIA